MEFIIILIIGYLGFKLIAKILRSVAPKNSHIQEYQPVQEHQLDEGYRPVKAGTYAEYSKLGSHKIFGKTRAEILEIYNPHRAQAKINESNMKAAMKLYQKVVSGKIEPDVAKLSLVVWSQKAAKDTEAFLELHEQVEFNTNAGYSWAEDINERLDTVAFELENIIEEIDSFQEDGDIHLSTDTDRESDEFAREIVNGTEFEVEYSDVEGVVTNRRIEPIRIEPISGRNGPDTFITAFCHLRGEERRFLSSRVLNCKNLHTGRKISDLGQYLRNQK